MLFGSTDLRNLKLWKVMFKKQKEEEMKLKQRSKGIGRGGIYEGGMAKENGK